MYCGCDFWFIENRIHGVVVDLGEVCCTSARVSAVFRSVARLKGRSFTPTLVSPTLISDDKSCHLKSLDIAQILYQGVCHLLRRRLAL